MTIARLDEVIVFDEEGRIEGLQFDGRERAVQRWKEKKEEEEFQALVFRLRTNQRFRERYENEPKFRERVKRQAAESRKRNWKKYLAKLKQQRREAYEANPTINVCHECGHEWAEPYEKLGSRKTKFCGKVCRNKFAGRNRTEEGRRNKGLLNMNLWPDVRQYIESNPWQTSEAIAIETGHKLPSVRSVISKWVKRGLVQRRGHKPSYFAIEEGQQ